MRSALRQANRIVVKVGSSSLTTAEGGIDPQRVQRLVDAIVDVRAHGTQVVLISSGAIAAGLAPLGLKRRPRDLATQQAAASVGQGLLMQEYTERFGTHGLRVGQLLLTVDDLTRQNTYKNALRTLGKLLTLQAVPIVNENDTVATHEIRFGDNDRLGALVAQMVRADALVLLSDVDGLYTAHPDDPGSERIGQVTDIAMLEVDTHKAGTAIGSGGMTTKLQAAQIATSAGIPVVLARADQALPAMTGQDVGTLFEPNGKRRPRRLLWLAHATSARGRLLLDDGAVRAVTQRKASLLAAGIAGVEGDFLAGDPVDLVAPTGKAVARGLVGFSSEDLPAMLGRNSHELAEQLGQEYEREVVHRDVLVVFRRPR
ncbi:MULTISPECIES: glutamate 5-kinase [unclassified Luteococcus]|uniref:glutamate 5-kinase n=1 Tax=unclassified Luteococcus TaxID=2639923 RepID=UPI00313C9401